MKNHRLFKTTREGLKQVGLVSCLILALLHPDTLLGNQPPTVKIFTPPAGALFQAPATVFIAASAQDVDGYLTIKTVEFFANSISLGVRTNFPTMDPIGPFKISWTNVPAGDYVLTAKATDEWGATGVSDLVPIRVGPGLITGLLKREVYTNLPGLLVSDLTNHSGFPLKPDLVGRVESFEVPTQFGENYGQRLSGYLLPPVTGLYRFFIASDDQGALFLSPDMDPDKRLQVAWESSWNFPRNWLDETGRASGPIALAAGKSYYVEALHKEAGGGDNFAVAWQLPGGDPPVPGSPPIPGDYLAVMGVISSNLPPVVSILQPQDGAAFSEGETIHVALSAVSKGSSIAKVEVFSDTSRLGSATHQLSHWPTNFVFWWSNAPVGSHILTARAEDAVGLARTSAPVRVTIRTNSQFPDLQFRLAFSNLNAPGSGAVFYKDYTLNGPTGPGRLLPGMRIVPESGQRFMYAANPFTVLKVDLLTGQVVEMNPQGPGIPELSWPMGMAFDAVHHRALLASLGGEGFLYAYDVNEGIWALVSSLHDLDLDSIVYHVADGAVYGFEVHRGVGSGSIYKLAADGTRSRQIVLPPIPYDVGVSDHQSELVSVGDYLVLLIAPDFGLRAGPSKDSRMYVIDPRSGQSWLVFQQDDPSNQPPSVAMVSPLSGATFEIGSNVTLEARVEDPDSSIARVEFLANGSFVGQGTTTNGTRYVLKWEHPALGGYDVVARAKDTQGATATSETVHLTIIPVPTIDGAVDVAFNAKLMGSVHTLAMGPSGKVLAGGEFTTTGATLKTNLALFNEDGTVDPAFNANLPAHRVCFVEPLPDGRFLVGSTGWSEPVNFPGLRRILPDGSIDQGFLPGIQFGAWGAIRSIALQPDGKVLVGGLFRIEGLSHVLARLHPDGRLDESFDAGDVHYTDSDDFIVKSIFVQEDGRILVQGAIDNVQSHPVPGLFRLNADGSLDETFNTQWSWVGSALLLPGGKILAGGATSGYANYGLFRLNADGSIDSTFRPFWRVPVTLALQSDGKIVAAVPGRLTAYYQVFRLLEDGTVDENFHSSDGANGLIRELLVVPAGALMVGGSFTAFDEVPAGGLARLINSSSHSPSFVIRSFAGATVTLTTTPAAQVQVYAVEDRLPPTWIATEISHGGVFDAANRKVKFGPFFDHEPRALTYVAKGLLPPGSGTVCGFEGTASADGLPSPILGDSCMRVIRPHPADLGPTDWRMTLDEVTAYGAAWRTGGVWQIEPNPIPMDYVTRAAALWRGGETYQVDVRLGGPPAWWVNLNRTNKLVSRHSETAPSVVRLAPEGVAPGDSLNVAVRAEPGSSTVAYAVEEAVPSGTTVLWIGQGGVLDPVGKLIRWGPFLDSNPRVLEYRLATGTNAQTLVFWGKGSFDGNPTVLGGSSSARYGARLAWASEPTAQNPTLSLRGFPGATYVLEWSSDLVRWTTLSTVSNLSGEARIPVDSPDPGNQRYYRARQLP